MAMNREQKRMMQKQGQVDADGAPAQAKQPPRSGRSPKDPRVGPVQFTREVRTELRKVAWPTRDEVIRFSIIVLITIIVVTSMIALLDYVFGETIFWVIDR